MTTLIPSTCPADAPLGEQALFAALRDAPGSDGWVAFHGLPIVQHAKQIEGEADFVVLVPGEGVLVIEVKSHRSVELDERNEWVLGGKRQQRSPITQARDNMRSVEAAAQGRARRVPDRIRRLVHAHRRRASRGHPDAHRPRPGRAAQPRRSAAAAPRRRSRRRAPQAASHA
ncbi:nuclease-related domain-containing protein [Agrococcus jejuensis]|uniref:nuclease-related domain-containing protein n=1 Tax=Agrococcus jejuensis TaxID=399736 RepID=UPI0016426B16|nr:nuclease-related domain-containing protein [Agrococcus jejuensis]